MLRGLFQVTNTGVTFSFTIRFSLSPRCASGTEYLVAARGLEQPRAGKGVVRPGVEILYGTDTSQTIR
jgi:hypothetical protein